MSAFDKILNGLGLARTNRLKQVGFSTSYDGANQTNKRRYIYRNDTDARASITPYVRSEILSRARYLYNNCGLVRGMVGDLCTYSIGAGLKPQSLAQDRGIAKEYETYFNEWQRVADVQRKMTLHGMAKLAVARIAIDGDLGFVMVDQDGFPQLQAVEGHRIGSEMFADGDIYDGVLMDKQGRPSAYRILSDTEENIRDIDARSFIHLFFPERFSQARGMSCFAHAVNNLQDQFEILGFERMAVKANSSIAIVETNEDGQLDTGRSYVNRPDATNSPDIYTEEFESGAVRYFRAGSGGKIEAHQSDRPSTVFAGFIDYIARDSAVGVGLPFEFVWNAEKLGGTTQRFVLQKAQRRFDEVKDMIENAFYRRVWGWVISKAIKSGKVTSSNDWWKVGWQAPAKISVDVGREAQQNRADIQAGIRTITEDAAERGIEFDDLRKTKDMETRDLLDRAQLIAKDYDIPLSVALNLMQQTPGSAPVQIPSENPSTQPVP